MPAAAPVVDQSAVRAWAREEGLQVGQRGRLPAALVEQFLAAKPERVAEAGGRRSSGGSSRSNAGSPPLSDVGAKPKSKRTGVSRTRGVAKQKPTASPAAAEVVAATRPDLEAADAFAPSAEQVELLEDLPDLLEQLTADLGAVQGALAALERENGELKKRVEGLENKRGLFNRR